MSRTSRKRILERRRAAELHPLSESLERAFSEIERPAPRYADAPEAAPARPRRSTLAQDARSNA